MRIAFWRLAMSLAVFGFSALAQNTVSSSNTGNVVHGGMGFSGQARFHGTPIVGAPYSAQRISEHVQVGADGTRFTTNNQQETIYRDSEGRVRTERPAIMGPNAPAGAPVIVEIEDPVANVSYTLDTQKKVAHRVAYAAPTPNGQAGGVGGSFLRGGQWFTSTNGAAAAMTMAPPPPSPSSTSLTASISTSPVPSRAAVTASSGTGRPQPELTTEDLGQQVIEGVAAEGHRTVQTWPAGAVGNDRPFQVVSETWFSPEIKETVLSKYSDPRSGENTTKLTNISRSEPDASLFMPPADYTVVDETGPFQIQWTGGRQ